MDYKTLYIQTTNANQITVQMSRLIALPMIAIWSKTFSLIIAYKATKESKHIVVKYANRTTVFKSPIICIKGITFVEIRLRTSAIVNDSSWFSTLMIFETEFIAYFVLSYGLILFKLILKQFMSFSSRSILLYLLCFYSINKVKSRLN